jgi:hypothetical protein
VDVMPLAIVAKTAPVSLPHGIKIVSYCYESAYG